MENLKPEPFKAEIQIIGINPFVFVPEPYLKYLFNKSGNDKGKIPVEIKIDGYSFKQTLVKYAGEWRLYLNTPMRNMVKKEVGDYATFEIEIDYEERIVQPNPKFRKALSENNIANSIFNGLAPYLQKEIIRYINNLKTEASVDKNIEKAIQFMLGNQKVIGRNHP